MRAARYQAAPRARLGVWGGARAFALRLPIVGRSGSKRCNISASRGLGKAPGMAFCIEFDGGGDGAIADVRKRLFCSRKLGCMYTSLGCTYTSTFAFTFLLRFCSGASPVPSTCLWECFSASWASGIVLGELVGAVMGGHQRLLGAMRDAP